MQGTFTIQGRLIGVNELINAARNNKFGSASQKKAQMKIVTDAILADEVFRNLRFEGKVLPCIDFYEPNEKRDYDNITGGGQKIIYDSLVIAGIIKNDSRKYISKSICEVYCDKLNPRIEVAITEL